MKEMISVPIIINGFVIKQYQNCKYIMLWAKSDISENHKKSRHAPKGLDDIRSLWAENCEKYEPVETSCIFEAYYDYNYVVRSLNFY